MAMWDVTLGRPFVRRALSHTRSVNTVRLIYHPFLFALCLRSCGFIESSVLLWKVDVALNDEYLCTGGDDQKIVSLSPSLMHRHKHTYLPVL